MTLLVRLLAACKRSPHARLATAVDGVTALLLAQEPRPALAVSKKRADLDAWAKVERSRDPLDFTRLLAAARGGQQADVVRQVTALARWKDPRFAAGMLALLERPPYAGIKSRPMLDTILELLAASGDVRAAAPARALAARYLGIVNSGTGRYVVQALRNVASELEAIEPPKLTAANEKLCLEAERLAPPSAPERPAVQDLERRIAALIDMVYAAPDDDRPRAVLADALLEAGDARGEFIRTQLAGGTVTPELRRDPAVAAWTQPLKLAGDCFFERGFPDSVNLYRNAAKSKNEQSWRTVRRVGFVDKLSTRAAVELLNAPHLAHVRRVSTLTDAQLAALGPAPRRWTSLEISRLSEPRAPALAPFPELTELRVSVISPVPPAFLAATPKLESLTLSGETLSPEALAPLSRLRLLNLSVRGAVDGLRLPPSIERAELLGAFTRARFDTPRLVQLRCTNAALQGAVVPSLRELNLFIAGHDARAFEGVAGLTHLTLRGEESALEPKLLAPLKRLLSLQLHHPAVGGAHLAGLDTLVHLSGFEGELGEVPALPSLLSLECTAPQDLESLRPFLSKNPQLEYLDLHWNQECPLHFWANEPIGKALPAWELLRALLEPSGVRVLRFHDRASLVRDGQRRWTGAIIHEANEDEEVEDEPGRILEALRAVFPLGPALRPPPRLSGPWWLPPP